MDIGHPSNGIEPIFISVKEAARALNVSTWTCYQLLDEGKIGSQYQGRRRLVQVASLRQYAADLPTEAPKAETA